ncbi:MAG: hypothetical protein QXO84_03180 [Candidatus Aenigmatarchaeota archaeon]
MKSQISLEYMIAFTIFLGVITYIYFRYIDNINPFIEDVIKEEKRAEAFQISEILINDPGMAKRVGLANESTNMTNCIVESKINNLNCNNLKQLLALDRPFNLFIFEVNMNTGQRTVLKSCISQNLRRDQINVTVRRYAVFDGGRIAEVVVEV